MIPMKISVYTFVNQFKNRSEKILPVKVFLRKAQLHYFTHVKRYLDIVSEEPNLAAIHKVLLLDLGRTFSRNPRLNS